MPQAANPANPELPAPTCRVRRTYIQHVWNQHIGTPHPAYKACTSSASASQYKSWWAMRTLSANMPMYSCTQSPFSLRKCPFGCDDLGDLHHLLLDCKIMIEKIQIKLPHYCPPISLSHFFNNTSADDLLTQVHHMITALPTKQQLRKEKKQKTKVRSGVPGPEAR